MKNTTLLHLNRIFKTFIWIIKEVIVEINEKKEEKNHDYMFEFKST